MEQALWEAVHRLAPLAPDFVSVTYGAGGSTRERTHATVERILRETPLVPAAHITCVEASRQEVDDVARAYWASGVRHVVALRGDPPAGPGVRFQPHPEGYACAADLVAGLKRVADFEITIGAYPEKHPSSPTIMADIDNLKAKVEAGATRAITQFFFDNSHYYRFLDRVRGRGINVPVTPGIVPIHNYAQVAMFAQRCGATVPEGVRRRFEGLENDPETTRLVAAMIAVEQVMDLVDHGVRELHFYTLNRANLVYAICHLLGLRPTPVANAAAA
jgi:methylenetetrahydrofolate reductase (NADPH)